MKKLFIEAKYKGKIDLPKNIELPGKIGLVCSIQFSDSLQDIKNNLEKKGIKVYLVGHVLGCNVEKATKIKNDVDGFLYVGTGRFHPLEILEKTEKDVFILNPFSGNAVKLNGEDLIKIKRRKKGKFIKFLSSRRIGILVSKKSGQFNLKAAMTLKKKLKKESYVFICDEIDRNKIENFSDIDYWVNTACSRIDERNIINLEDIKGKL